MTVHGRIIARVQRAAQQAHRQTGGRTPGSGAAFDQRAPDSDSGRPMRAYDRGTVIR